MMARRRSWTRSLLCAAAGAWLGAGPVMAHSGAPPAAQPEEAQTPKFKLEKLTDRAYCLYGQGGNVGFLVTDTGVVVVDDEFEEVAQGIVDQIRSVTDRPIRYLVNTHYHGDHTGGNPVFVRCACGSAVRRWMSSTSPPVTRTATRSSISRRRRSCTWATCS